ncbi:MAG: lipocalin family protein [Nitrospirota bacterium]
MRDVRVLMILSTVLLAAFSLKSGHALPPPAVVPFVDLARYSGTWYEIARFPNFFQKGCSSTSAAYTLLPDGKVEVVNRCTRGGKADSIKGTATVADPVTSAKLEVTFFWPFSGEYWIIELGAAYEYAVVSNSDRSRLWVLSRTPVMDDRVYAGIVERLRGRGFKTDRLVRTEQR